MAAPPGIETYPVTPNLLVTEELRRAYTRASDPKLQEVATRPLFEELFNEFLRNRQHPLSVYAEQELDDSQRRVDIAVGFHDPSPSPKLIFVLLCETKRQNTKNLGELEAQIEDYADRYIHKEFGGRAIYPAVYGATAYGTKIRFYWYSRESGTFDRSKSAAYLDLRTDGLQIHDALARIWEFRQRLQTIVGA